MNKEREKRREPFPKTPETIEGLVGQDVVLNEQPVVPVEPEQPVVPVEPEQPTKEDAPQTSVMEKGVVSNCLLLNVRETPDVDGSVVARLKKGDRVEISHITDKFYRIIRKDGTVGYCMKGFITIY